MNKKLKVLSLAMGLAFVAPNLALAADSDLNVRISRLDSEINDLEAKYEALVSTYKNVNKSSRAHVNKDGKYVSNKEAIQEHLFNVSNKLDEYVANVTPSLEQPMLGVYFLNGAKLGGVTIRQKNADDLYKYLKGYFVMKEGKDKKTYDALLMDYVNAISDSVVMPDLDAANDLIFDQIKEKREALELAKARRKSLLRIRDERKILNLKRSISDAETTLAACKQLISLAPNKVANVRGELDRLMASQKNLIERGKLLLAKYE